MKKLTMMAVMVAMSTAAFAQDDLVKQAQKLSSKGEFEEAIKTITPALTSDQTEDKAAAWNTLSNIHYDYFTKLDQIGAEYKVKQEGPTCDSLLMYGNIVNSLKAALTCDEYDRQPNEKGKVKLRFRQASQERFANGRLQLIFAGEYMHKHKKAEDAQKAWGLYVDSATDPMFTGIDATADQNRSLIAYYAGLISYQNKDYESAQKYARVAAQDSSRTADANEILLFAQKDGAKTKEDSLKYVTTLKDLHKQNPNEDRYLNLLMNYYSASGDNVAFAQWIDEELAVNPNNKMLWAQKGLIDMNAQKYDEAIASYNKAAELDPMFVQVVFNSGVCLNSKAIDLKDKLADKNTGNLTTENFNKVKAILMEAKTYLERARELDPTQQTVKWAYPLYQIYYSIGDKEKSAEMEALLNN